MPGWRRAGSGPRSRPRPSRSHEPSRVERVRPRTVITIVAAIVAAYLLIGQLGSVDLSTIFAAARWRWVPLLAAASALTYFGAALALTESVTRLSDRSDPVPDDVWDEAAKHYDEQGLAALVLSIATTNVFNRLNATVKQPVGAWG